MNPPKAKYCWMASTGLTKGKTSIIISHRFSTVRMADNILVLEDGKVLETGTDEALMENNKLYAAMILLKAAGYP